MTRSTVNICFHFFFRKSSLICTRRFYSVVDSSPCVFAHLLFFRSLRYFFFAQLKWIENSDKATSATTDMLHVFFSSFSSTPKWQMDFISFQLARNGRRHCRCRCRWVHIFCHSFSHTAKCVIYRIQFHKYFILAHRTNWRRDVKTTEIFTPQ